MKKNRRYMGLVLWKLLIENIVRWGAEVLGGVLDQQEESVAERGMSVAELWLAPVGRRDSDIRGGEALA